MKRGYAVSGMLYTILVLFMALLLSFLYTMQNKKNILDKLKTEVVEAFYCSKADNIEDLRGSTVIATAVSQEGDNALIQLPKEGRYDTTSYLSVPMSEIGNNLINGVDLLATVSSTTSTTVTVSDLSKYSEVLLAMEGTNDKIIQAGQIMTYEEFKLGGTIVLGWYNDNKVQTRGSFTYVSDTSVAMYLTQINDRNVKIYGIK